MKSVLLIIAGVMLLALGLAIAAYSPPEHTAAPAQTSALEPVETTPADAQQIQIIDGQVWVAIPVDGMPEQK